MDNAAMNNDGRIVWFDDFETEPVNRYRFLSNFYIGQPIVMPSGTDFATGEHAFQAYKAAAFEDFERVRDAVLPGAAKSTGRRIQLRSDWEAVKYDVMAAVIRAKFDEGRDEATMLLETGDALLVEGTWWHDRVWGVDLSTGGTGREHTAMGRNWLGTLLMARRAELRAEREFGYVTVAGTYNLTFAEKRS